MCSPAETHKFLVDVGKAHNSNADLAGRRRWITQTSIFKPSWTQTVGIPPQQKSSVPVPLWHTTGSETKAASGATAWDVHAEHSQTQRLTLPPERRAFAPQPSCWRCEQPSCHHVLLNLPLDLPPPSAPLLQTGKRGGTTHGERTTTPRSFFLCSDNQIIHQRLRTST